VTASPNPTTFKAAGGTATISTRSVGYCPEIKAETNASWLTITPLSGNRFSIHAVENTDFASRSATVQLSVPSSPSLAVKPARIDQHGLVDIGPSLPGPIGPTTNPGPTGCPDVNGSLTQSSFLAGGGGATLSVSGSGNCQIAPKPGATWITVQPVGANRYTVTVAPNPNSQSRSSTIVIYGSVSVGVDQAGIIQPNQSPCYDIVLSLNSGNFLAGGGTAVATVTPSGACSGFKLTSDATWITVSPISATQFSVRIAPNTGPTRTATLKITSVQGNLANAAVQQAAADCIITVSPTSLSFTSAGSPPAYVPASVNVTTNRPDCTYTVGPVTGNNGVTWVHLGATQGRGSGKIQVTVDSDTTDNFFVNNLQLRTASFKVTPSFAVAGVTVTIEQQAPKLPGPGSGNGCQCTGTNCGANIQLGISRSLFGPGGGQATITVLAPDNCQWDLTTDDNWLQFPNTRSGGGNGQVTVTVPPYTGSGPRVIHITSPQATADINGQKPQVTITQQGQ
jgi:hypothetical protein